MRIVAVSSHCFDCVCVCVGGWVYFYFVARPRFVGNFAGRKTGKKKDPAHFRHEPVLTEHYAERTRLKIRAILNMAVEHNHRCVVLGAFGCGAFANPPRHIAQLFHDELYSAQFRGCFSRVVFAIVDDGNTRKRHNPDGNLKPFQEQFASKPAERKMDERETSGDEKQVGGEGAIPVDGVEGVESR
jgi:hypothetical protein